MKVLICDYTGNAEKWLDQFAIKENLDVVGIISPVDKTQRSLLLENSWEFLLIFEEGMREDFNKLTKFLKLSPQRVIYALDLESWAEHPAATYALIDPSRAEAVYRTIAFNNTRQLNYFLTATTAEGLNYVATSRDIVIIRQTYIHRKNWSKDEMNLFYLLAKKFYNVDDSDGYFLDLGANIGTTCIYFKKILTPNLKILAFEPDKENFKLLRANLILNDIDNAVAENYGLGDNESEMNFFRDKLNPGHNGIFSSDTGSESEKVKIIPLDKYLAENKISPKEVKYIWIDAEGFEPQILSGAEKLLSENPAPVFMEFNPVIYQKYDSYGSLMNLLTKFYVGFVLSKETLQNIETEVYPINKLWDLKDCGQQDIFLIHKL